MFHKKCNYGNVKSILLCSEGTVFYKQTDISVYFIYTISLIYTEMIEHLKSKS